MFNMIRCVNIKKKGLTLIETVVSFAILMIVLGPMLGIINLSVKNNKAGEKTQTGLYVLQRYAEKYKSEDIDTSKIVANKFKDDSGNYVISGFDENPTDNNVPKGYFVHVKVEALDQYKFADVVTSVATAQAAPTTGYSSIDYDVKLVIDTNNLNQPYIEISGKDGSEHEQSLVDNYIIEISNGDARTSTLMLVTVKDSSNTVIAGPWEISKIRADNASIKDGNIIVQVDGNKNSSNGSLNINCYNKIDDGNMNVYSAELKDTSANLNSNKGAMNCTINNCEGKVKVYSNIAAIKDLHENHKNNTRLYKITIGLYKVGDNAQDESVNPVQKVIAYKTVQQ